MMTAQGVLSSLSVMFNDDPKFTQRLHIFQQGEGVFGYMKRGRWLPRRVLIHTFSHLGAHWQSLFPEVAL